MRQIQDENITFNVQFTSKCQTGLYCSMNDIWWEGGKTIFEHVWH